MSDRTWTRRSFLRAAGLVGLAPLGPLHAAASDEDWSGELARALEYAPEYMSDAANQRDVRSILRFEPITGARFDDLWGYLESSG